MIGSFFALLSAILYAVNTILIRRAVLKVADASLGTLISVPMALPLFSLLLAFSGQIQSIFLFSWQSYVWLSLAGVIHFVVGRSLNYRCVQLIGANIASIIRQIDILVSVVFGIAFLQEALSLQLAIGVVFIIIGITLPRLDYEVLRSSNGQFLKIPPKAFVLGFGCGLSWGLAPIFVKLGLKGSGSPIAGAFISFLAATIVLSISLMDPKRRTSFVDITGKAVGLFFIAGLLSFAANVARYEALGLAPASVVTPLVSISPVFLLFLSFVFNRRLEIFSRSVIIGTIAVVIGSLLLI